MERWVIVLKISGTNIICTNPKINPYKEWRSILHFPESILEIDGGDHGGVRMSDIAAVYKVH